MKTLQMMIKDLKERLLKGDVTSYAWLPMDMMWADLLTKEKKLPESLEDVLFWNILNIQGLSVNKVKAVGQEVSMINIHYRKAVEKMDNG